MKKILTLIVCLVAGLMILCSCGEERIYEQTGNLGYEVEAGWDSRTVTPAPSTMKQYDYENYSTMVGSVSYFFYEDPLREALEYAIGGVDAADGMGASYDDAIVSEGTVNEMPAREAAVRSDRVDGKYGFYGIFTAIETDRGIYVIATLTEDPEQESAVEDKHRLLKETVQYVDADDGEVYAKNILQFSDYICNVPGWDTYVVDTPWWTSRIAEENGMINYIFGYDIASLKIVPMDNVELTDEVIHETLGYIYDGNIAPKATCTLSNQKLLECSMGSAVYYELDLHFGDDQSNTVKASAVFVKNKEGQAVCCFSNTSDSDLTYDYTGMLKSMQLAEPVYDKVDMLYELATDYTGDNSAIINLMNALEFGVYGEYTIELKTEKEPYGLTVKYSGDVKDYDFQREAVMMLGLVGNLDYIEIKDSDGGIVRYDTDVAKSLLMYDVKEMAADKAKLECYYLETLY